MITGERVAPSGNSRWRSVVSNMYISCELHQHTYLYRIPPKSGPHFCVDPPRFGRICEDPRRSIDDVFCVSRIAKESSDSLQDISVANQMHLIRSIWEGKRCRPPSRTVRDGVHLLQQLSGILESEPELLNDLQYIKICQEPSAP